MQNFKELKNDSLELVQRGGDTDYGNFLGSQINVLLKTMYNQYDFWAECQDIHNFTTADGDSQYAMPLRFNKPYRIYDLTNNKKLKVITEEVYFDANIANIADSVKAKVPNTARMYGVDGVQVQVSTSGETVQVTHSVSANIITRVEGFINSSLTIIGYENITATGTFAVSGTTTFYKILHFSKASDTTGFVTLENSSGTDLTILGPTDRVARHKLMNLGLIPNQANSMRTLFKKNSPKLINDNDYPFVECDDYLIYGVAAMAMQEEKETLPRAQLFQSISDRSLNGILTDQYNKLGTGYQNMILNQVHQAHRA